MKKAIWIVSIITIFLLLLAACGTEPECETSDDCSKTFYTGSCTEEGNCSYTPIPDQCGNDLCESGENKCLCPTDCGACSGTVPGAQYLEQSCDADDKCTTDITTQEDKAYTSNAIRSGGDTFTLSAIYKEPFNVNRDQLTLQVYLSAKGVANSNHRVTSVELSGRGSDGTRVVLANQAANAKIVDSGREYAALIPLNFDFPTGLKEDNVAQLELRMQYEYTVETSRGPQAKTATITDRWKTTSITYTVPSATYACPEDCDDQNPDTEDICGLSTNFLCKNIAKPNTCGNQVCDDGENQCSCAQDCGRCDRRTPSLTYGCKEGVCAADVNLIAIRTQTLLDERQLPFFKIKTMFTFKNPFEVNKEEFKLDFRLISKGDDVDKVVITSISLMDGQQVIAQVTPNTEISKTGLENQQSATLSIGDIGTDEIQAAYTIRVDYKSMKGDEGTPGYFTKPLGKIRYIQP
jgi:hypothetical protein